MIETGLQNATSVPLVLYQPGDNALLTKRVIKNLLHQEKWYNPPSFQG